MLLTYLLPYREYPNEMSPQKMKLDVAELKLDELIDEQRDLTSAQVAERITRMQELAEQHHAETKALKAKHLQERVTLTADISRTHYDQKKELSDRLKAARQAVRSANTELQHEAERLIKQAKRETQADQLAAQERARVQQ